MMGESDLFDPVNEIENELKLENKTMSKMDSSEYSIALERIPSSTGMTKSDSTSYCPSVDQN